MNKLSNPKNKTQIQDFTRGAEIWIHQLRMFTSGIFNVILIGLTVGLLVGGLYAYKKLDSNDLYQTHKYAEASFKTYTGFNKGKIAYKIHDRELLLPVATVERVTKEYADHGIKVVKNAIGLTILFSLSASIMLSLYWFMFGNSIMGDEVIRGATLIHPDSLKALYRKQNKENVYEIAGVPIAKGTETLNFMLVGSPGSGKSQQIISMMKQVRAQGKRAIIYDPSGEFTQFFYREGVDVLMNPFDDRCPNWNVWCEIKENHHYDNIANGLIADNVATSEPFFNNAARILLTELIKVLSRDNRMTNQELFQSISLLSIRELSEVLKNTPGASYVDVGAEKTALSLKQVVQNKIDSFKYLRDDGDLFSIKDWVADEGDSWMFITVKESVREALKPILSLWVDVTIKAVLDLVPIHKERLWLFLDELPTLQKLEVLQLSLTNTRKFGLCHVVGFQDIHQLYAIYGDNFAKTMMSSLQTKLMLRVTDHGTAQVLSDVLGQMEVSEKELSRSMGINSQRDGDSFNSKRTMRPIVLASEIMSLPDMVGYIKLPGEFPIVKVQYFYVPTQSITVPFIARKDESVLMGFSGFNGGDANTSNNGNADGKDVNFWENPDQDVEDNLTKDNQAKEVKKAEIQSEILAEGKMTPGQAQSLDFDLG